MSEVRQPLPPRQRKFKLGTTGFMLAIHIGAVAALLPMYRSWQGLVVLAVLYWMTVLGVTLGPGTSRALADEILGRGVPPRLLPFSPTRFARRVKPMPALTPSGVHA